MSVTRVQARASLLSIALDHAIEAGLERQGPRDAAIHEARELRREVGRAAATTNAALFECRGCDGHHLTNGRAASPYQVHRRASATLLVCDGCGGVRDIMREGEAIPVAVGRWPDLPGGITVPAEAVGV